MTVRIRREVEGSQERSGPLHAPWRQGRPDGELVDKVLAKELAVQILSDIPYLSEALPSAQDTSVEGHSATATPHESG